MKTRALLCILLLAACDESTETSAPVVLAGDGSLNIQLSDAPAVALERVNFRVKVRKGWFSTHTFGAPSLSVSDGVYTVTYPSGQAGGPAQVQLKIRPPSGKAGAFVVQPVVIAPAGGLELAAFELVVSPGHLKMEGIDKSILFLNNGYQSWSFTGVLRLAAPFAQPAWSDAAGAFKAGDGDPTYEKAGVGWWFGLLAPDKDGPCLVAGAASARHRRTVVLPSFPSEGKVGLNLRSGTSAEFISIKGGASASLDSLVLAAAKLPDEALDAYTAEVARATGADKLRKAKVADPTGWWSWNIFFHKVTEQNMLDHADIVAKQLKDKGFGLIELDDGYEKLWGDWEATDTTRFPSGLSGLAQKIKARGLAAGLWMAPFLVDTRSTLVKDHPDWFVKEAGTSTALTHQQLGVSGTMQVLDPTHPGAAKHLQGLFARLVKAGYTLFKLDFLYAGALKGKRHDGNVTGVEALGKGLELIRGAAPEPVHINLCGMPLLPAVGRGHSVRYGSDIVFTQLPPGFVLVAHEARNVMLRGFLDRLIRNDPDQALVRAPLTADEARAAATLTAMTGFHSSGDDLTKLPADRRAMITHPALLRIARLGRSARAADMLSAVSEKVIQSPVLDTGLMLNDPRTVPPSRFLLEDGATRTAYLALFNWQTTGRAMRVDLSAMNMVSARVKELWTGKALVPKGNILSVSVAGHGVALLELKR